MTKALRYIAALLRARSAPGCRQRGHFVARKRSGARRANHLAVTMLGICSAFMQGAIFSMTRPCSARRVGVESSRVAASEWKLLWRWYAMAWNTEANC
jgi:hypothetical protein